MLIPPMQYEDLCGFTLEGCFHSVFASSSSYVFENKTLLHSEILHLLRFHLFFLFLSIFHILLLNCNLSVLKHFWGDLLFICIKLSCHILIIPKSWIDTSANKHLCRQTMHRADGTHTCRI